MLSDPQLVVDLPSILRLDGSEFGMYEIAFRSEVFLFFFLMWHPPHTNSSSQEQQPRPGHASAPLPLSLSRPLSLSLSRPLSLSPSLSLLATEKKKLL